MKKIILISGLATILAGCYNDKADKLYPLPPANTCDTTGTLSYTTDITPIINSYCAINSSCHLGGAAVSGFDLTNYNTMKQVATTNDILVDVINGGLNNYPAMPLLGSPLSSCDINKLTRWVNEGAPDN